MTPQQQIVLLLPTKIIAKLEEEAARLGLTPEEYASRLFEGYAKRILSEKEEGK